MRRTASVIALLLAGGCSANYRYEAQRWAQEFEEVDTGHFRAKEVVTKTGARLVKFPSNFRTRERRNNTVWGELYARRRPERGAIVMLPAGFGELIIERTLALELAERGYAVYLMYLPYTHLRAPQDARKRLAGGVLTRDMRRNERLRIQTIQDARRAAAMLEKRFPHLKGRTGLLGISVGGVLGSIAFSSDDTFRAAAFCLAGGNLAESLWSNSIFTARLKARLRAEGYTLRKLRHAIRKLEPTYYARPEKARRVLLVGATKDEAVTRSSVEALAEAYGGARVSWVAGNYLQAATRLASKLDLIDIHFLLHLAPDTTSVNTVR